jgi:hypothetical protein
MDTSVLDTGDTDATDTSGLDTGDTDATDTSGLDTGDTDATDTSGLDTGDTDATDTSGTDTSSDTDTDIFDTNSDTDSDTDTDTDVGNSDSSWWFGDTGGIDTDPPLGASMLIISEVCDTTKYDERFLELYNPTGVAFDLTGFVLRRYNNGSTSSSASVQLDDFGPTLNAGETLIVAKNQVAFEGRFGTGLNVIFSSTVDVNGDDVLQLEDGATGGVYDAYGALGVDGSGTLWEYENTCATRVNGSLATMTFDVSEWSIAPDDLGATPGSY